MSSQPRAESDVEMSGTAQEMNNNIMQNTPDFDTLTAEMKDHEEDSPTGSSDSASFKGEANSSDQESNVEPGLGRMPSWGTTVGWGFDVLANDQANAPTEPTLEQDEDQIPSTTGEEPREDAQSPRDADVDEAQPQNDDENDQAIQNAVDEDLDQQAINDTVTDDIRAQEDAIDEQLDEQAVTDAIAEEVREQETAANQANARDWLAEQDRWLNQLANDNPEEFDRLVASGVIDPEFVPRQPNDENNEADDADGGEDGADGEDAQNNQDDGALADGDGQAPVPPAVAAPCPAGIAAANQAAPAQPANDGNANQAPNTDHFVWLADRADAGDENDKCPACQTPFGANEAVVYLNCGHAWCSDCLNSNFRSALQNRASWPPRCCQVPIETSSIAHLLEEDLQVDILVKGEEYQDPKPIYCQTPKCLGGYISVTLRSGQWAACQVCCMSTCMECRAPANAHNLPGMHPSIDSIIQKEDKDLADGQGWKQCPGCRNLVERTEGCDHMMCECGISFCYQCGMSLENSMPCECQGTPEWVAQMRQEAADAAAAGNPLPDRHWAGAGWDGADNDDREDDDEEDEDDDRDEGERDEVQEDEEVDEDDEDEDGEDDNDEDNDGEIGEDLDEDGDDETDNDMPLLAEPPAIMLLERDNGTQDLVADGDVLVVNAPRLPAPITEAFIPPVNALEPPAPIAIPRVPLQIVLQHGDGTREFIAHDEDTNDVTDPGPRNFQYQDIVFVEDRRMRFMPGAFDGPEPMDDADNAEGQQEAGR